MDSPIVQLWQQVLRSAHRLDQLSRGWLGLLAKAFADVLKPDTAMMAAAIAYFSLFSLFPLILLSISLASYSFDPMPDQRSIIQELEFVAPAIDQLLGENIENIVRARGPITGAAAVSLVWSASTIFHTLNQTLNGIWGRGRSRPLWKRRGLSILFVLAFVGPVLILASIAGSLLANLRSWLPDVITPISSAVSFSAAVLLDIALFMLLYMLLPHGVSTWREIWPGAVGAGLLWELAKKAFLSFVSAYISVTNLVYGSVTTIIAFLLWAYLSSLIFLFGAFFSVSIYQHKQNKDPVK
jgi:membrane protein